MSKPGLLRVVREVFEAVVEEVCGRKFSTGDCLMSGLAVFLEKHASLLQFDVTRHRHKVVEMNLRRLYGLAQVPCDTTLRRRLDPISPVCGIGGRFSRFCNAPSAARHCSGCRRGAVIIW